MNKFLQAVICLLLAGSMANAQNSLTHAAISLFGTDYDPEWIKSNKVVKIIEREYIDKDTAKLGLVNYLYFDTSGYISKEICGMRDPKSRYPPEEDHFSVISYNYEKNQGFIYRYKIVIRKFNQYGPLPKTDTLNDRVARVYNPLHVKQREENGQVVDLYEYDKKGRLVKISESPVRSIIFEYKGNNVHRIRLTYSKMYPFMKNSERCYIYNSKGQIVETEGTDKFTHKFYYNEKGEIVQRVDFSEGVYICRYTYEYVRQ